MIIVSSFDYQLQLNCQQIYCLHEFSFHFLMNRCILCYKTMKSVEIKINRWTKWVCHRFLPIDRYNRYQSNRIYSFLSIYRLATPGFVYYIQQTIYSSHLKDDNRELEQLRRRPQRQLQKSNRFDDQKDSSARASRFLVHFFDVHSTTTTWNLLICRFMEDVNIRRRIFLPLFEHE